MAIGRITGPMLFNNLERQGVDLAIDGNLIYADVTNRRVGINQPNPAYSVDAPGNVRFANITILGNTITSNTGKIGFGSAANIVITGGASYDVLYTDGQGNLQFGNLNAISTVDAFAGNNIILGVPTDSTLSANAAYDGWETTTKVTDAIDNLNQLALNLGQGTFVGNVQFTANVVAGASPTTVRFTGTSAGTPNTYYWDFGDGTTSTASATVNHTYTNILGGVFTVYYRASNSSGTWGGSANAGAIGSVDSYTYTNYITLYTPTPVPSFTTNAVSINTANTMSITDTSIYATNYSVYWGDGTSTISATSGGTQNHTYTNTSGDTDYSIILQANSTTAGPSPVSVNSAPTTEYVYSTHTPVITANVSYVVNWESNGGGTVNFTNGTTSSPGADSIFPASQQYQYWWNDSTANTNVSIGSGSTGSGDTGYNLAKLYTISSAQQATGANVTYNSQLLIWNGHTSSPFHSTNVIITVVPSVRSNISARANIVSDRSADTSLTGYIFTDYNGYDRSLFTFSTAAQNTTVYNWGFGDSTTSGNLSEGVSGTVTGGNITHSYSASSVGTKTANLTAYGSPGSIFQTNSKTVNITISSVPTVSNLSAKSLSMSTTTQGTNAYLAAGATDNTSGNIALAGTAVTRYATTTPLVTSTITQANCSLSGTVTAVINGAADGSTQFFSGNSRANTYTSLVVTLDQDAHSYTPGTYPTGFYKLFDAYVSKPLAGFAVGYNDINLNHSASGKTNNIGFVKDSITSAPTLVTTTVTISNVTATTIRTISGIPYYQAGGNVVIQNLQAYNWIGQTYNNTTTPMTISANATLAEGTSGTIHTSQTKTYDLLNRGTNYLTSGIPQADTGATIGTSYTFGNIYLNLDGTAAAVGNTSAKLTNVNGDSSVFSLPTYLNVYSSTYTGFNETSIACSAGAAAGNTTIAKRIVLSSANITTPIYANTVTNYYSDAAWSSTSTVTDTSEAVIRWGNLKVNTTNYSVGYLPVGPNLAVSPTRTTTQNFKFAFQRPIMQNMKVIFTGRVAGMFIAAPGTKLTDTSSTLNGWLDANVAYAGSGFPGQGAGGNGSTGCAVGTTVPTSTFVSNVAYTLTLGSGDLSSSAIHQLLINLVLGPNDFVSNIYLGSYA